MIILMLYIRSNLVFPCAVTFDDILQPMMEVTLLFTRSSEAPEKLCRADIDHIRATTMGHLSLSAWLLMWSDCWCLHGWCMSDVWHWWCLPLNVHHVISNKRFHELLRNEKLHELCTICYGLRHLEDPLAMAEVTQLLFLISPFFYVTLCSASWIQGIQTLNRRVDFWLMACYVFAWWPLSSLWSNDSNHIHWHLFALYHVWHHIFFSVKSTRKCSLLDCLFYLRVFCFWLHEKLMSFINTSDLLSFTFTSQWSHISARKEFSSTRFRFRVRCTGRPWWTGCRLPYVFMRVAARNGCFTCNEW